ncbi:MAG: hypothetical protein IPN63_07765 [Gammaproteobacteria bacterium]|nr:hypothetical protein [Gammaproteobacteria bacterium]MBK9427271.1 hypothetical protein [Gammaproteobacteria bacterium]
MLDRLRNPARRPPSPGVVLREDALPALAMTQTEFARRLSGGAAVVPIRRPVA